MAADKITTTDSGKGAATASTKPAIVVPAIFFVETNDGKLTELLAGKVFFRVESFPLDLEVTNLDKVLHVAMDNMIWHAP